MPAPDLVAVAHHEAGHWVIALSFGSNVGEISVGWDHITTSWGRTAMGDLPDLFLRSHRFAAVEEAMNDPRYRDAVERQATMNMAGPAAESRFLHRRTWRGAKSDIIATKLLLAGVNDTERAWATHYKRIRRRSRILVELPSNWTAIEALARAVLRHETLDVAQAIGVVNGARI